MSAMRFRLLSVILLLSSSTGFAAEKNSRVTEGDFDADVVKIHYLVTGEGEPVILIHGLYSSAQLNWNLPGIVKKIAKKNKVIALDLPGHGKSDKPRDNDAYGEQLAEDVVLLMDHLNVDKAHVVGYSLGGMVAAKVMVEHPDRCYSGTLAGMGWFKEGSGMQLLWKLMPADKKSDFPAEFTKNISKLAITEDELKEIDLPVKVLIGAKDPVNKMYVAPLRKVRSDWPVVEIPDAGHIACILKPMFHDELVKWLTEQTEADKKKKKK